MTNLDWLSLGVMSSLLLSGCAETAGDIPALLENKRQPLSSFEDCEELAAPTPEENAAFYTFDPNSLAGEVGTLIRCQKLSSDQRYAGYDLYRVVYRTSSRVTEGGVTRDLIVPASGSVLLPQVHTQSERPVIAHTHGLSGTIAACGPSRRGLLDSFATLQQVASVVTEPVIVVPDYVGLGLDHTARVPDVNHTITNFFNIWQRIRPFSNVSHPFVSLVGEGRATVDLVRAARTLPDAHTGETPSWVVVGQSQGGHAALAAAEVVQGGYGSELDLRAVIAGAPGSEFEDRSWDPSLKNGIEAMVTVSMTLENRDLRASSFLNDRAMSAFYHSTNGQCTDANGLVNMISVYGLAGNPWRRDPYQDPAALAVVRANSPGRVRVPTPIFVGQVRNDPLIKQERTRKFIDRTRGLGNDVTYCEYAPLDNTVTMLNHDAFKRIRDTSATCMDRYGVAQTLPAQDGGADVPLTMLAWLQRTY